MSTVRSLPTTVKVEPTYVCEHAASEQSLWLETGHRLLVLTKAFGCETVQMPVNGYERGVPDVVSLRISNTALLD